MGVSTRPGNESSNGGTGRLIAALSSGVVVLLLLLLGEMAVAARSVELERWARGAVTLVPLGALGVIFGFVLGRSRVPDLLAHLWAALLGVTSTLLITAWSADELGVSFAARVRYLADLLKVWTRESLIGRPVDEDLVLIFSLGLLVWLIAYTAAWFLFRRGWYMPAVVLPGVLIVINVTNGEAGSSAAALLYVVMALALVAVQVSRLRTASWQRAGLAFSTIAWRASAVGGAIIALLAVSLVWSSPIEPPEGMMNAVADRLDRPVTAMQSAWNDLARRLNPDRGQGESFSEFGDSFEMGGELNLSDEPVAILQSDSPHYLAAQRYAEYTGQGWQSGDDAAFPQEPGSDEPEAAPAITFRPDQTVYLSDNVLGARERVDGTVRILMPSGNLLLTIETYASSSERVSATMSWSQLVNEPFDLTTVQQGDLPVEIRQIAMLLRQAEFTETVNGNFVVEDVALSTQIDRELAALAQRFLQATWTVDNQGRVTTLSISGFLPNYDDIDAVAPDHRITEGDVYDVTGWQSTASADQLRNASGPLPTYIAERYLGVPVSVTPETRDLAARVAGPETNVFDTAMAIQDYLRAAYPYDEQISGPSGEEDAVHYFLFEEQRGYCEYFASAMVVMLRSLDVPARLVAGFRDVPFDPDADGYLYLQKQAHTWVEVYFPGYGWIAFEPTPAEDPFTYDGEEQAEDALPTPTPAVETPTPEPTEEPVVISTPEPAGTNVANVDGPDDGRPAWQVIAGGVAALAGVAAVAMFLVQRRRPGPSPGSRFYRQLIRSGQRAGIRPTPTTTPRELANRIADAVPPARSPAVTMSQLYRKEVYGRQPLTDEDRAMGEMAERLLRRAVAMRRVRRRRGRTGE